jgi:PAS domain S-box-containing protein
MADPLIRRLTRGRSPIDIGFAIGGMALVLVGVLSFLSARRLRVEALWVAHTYEVIAHLDRVDTQIRMLDRASDPATVSEIGIIRQLTSDNAAQQDRLATLRRVIDGPPRAALALIGQMQAEEERLLLERRARADRSSGRSGAAIVFSTVLAIGLMGVALRLLHADLRARRATELALQDSESKHRLLMEQAADAILLVNHDAVCVEANARATQIVGRTRSEIIGLPLKAFVRGERAGSPAALPMLRYGEVTTGEFWVVQPNDARVPVEIRATMLDDGRVQIIARDISERKEVDRLKGEFVSMVSHELRTPLTSIRGALGLLASGRLDATPEKRQRMLDLAAGNTDRLIRLINDILDVERVSSGGASFEQSNCAVRPLVEQVVDTVTPLAEKAGIALRWTADDAHVWADPDRVTQTLSNLVDNAIKFSPAGSAVDVRATTDGSLVTFAVQDHGRGIPREKLGAVFDRFQQVDASDSRDKGGSGLGLAISRAIVQQHGGTMWVDSALGEGSTFYFTIPLVADQLVLTGNAGAPLVLICDDDVDLVVVLRATLEQRGYRVMTAHRGKEAMDRFDAVGADVMILDWVLPDMTGLKVLRHMNRKTPVPKIIVYTAAFLEQAERDFTRSMGAAIVTKGRMSPEHLADEVARLVGPVAVSTKEQPG